MSKAPYPAAQPDDEQQWSTGVTVKRIRDGYSWTVSVAADSNCPEDIEAAISRALEGDALLRRKLS